ncbi:hypothetical protein [Streptomyces sp. NPDC057686]|uniref:hypothetical protein n=1 Tax=Streptomyces sp. NPDC057686 TaxID=3346212 RepID=UPI00367C95BD
MDHAPLLVVLTGTSVQLSSFPLTDDRLSIFMPKNYKPLKRGAAALSIAAAFITIGSPAMATGGDTPGDWGFPMINHRLPEADGSNVLATDIMVNAVRGTTAAAAGTTSYYPVLTCGPKPSIVLPEEGNEPHGECYLTDEMKWVFKAENGARFLNDNNHGTISVIRGKADNSLDYSIFMTCQPDDSQTTVTCVPSSATDYKVFSTGEYLTLDTPLEIQNSLDSCSASMWTKWFDEGGSNQALHKGGLSGAMATRSDPSKAVAPPNSQFGVDNRNRNDESGVNDATLLTTRGTCGPYAEDSTQ